MLGMKLRGKSEGLYRVSSLLTIMRRIMKIGLEGFLINGNRVPLVQEFLSEKVTMYNINLILSTVITKAAVLTSGNILNPSRVVTALKVNEYMGYQPWVLRSF